MSIVSRAGISSAVKFGSATIQLKNYQQFTERNSVAPRDAPSAESLLRIHHLREALAALKPGRIQPTSQQISAQAASAISSTPLDFASSSTQLKSVEEINTAPTSFEHNGPDWIGSTVTAPWSGLGSTADATVSGTYDGSNGAGTLKFEVNREGTHGDDDLRIKVFDDNGNQIETIDIKKNDPINQTYELSNGLSITLGAGDLVKNDYFEVDTAVLSTSYTPNDPGWTGSTAAAGIGGSYDGSNGTGDLTFEVTRGGVHGQDDLKLKVYAPDSSYIETIDVKKNHAIDKVYSLSNGLTFTLGEGELIKNETFAVAVDASDPANFTADPPWEHGSAIASITGTYDGSNGTGTLTFEARQSGVHGEVDIQVRVFAPDGSTLEDILVSQNDPIDTAYTLSNGLSVTFSAGDFIKSNSFTVDVAAAASFSTAPNEVESTATPAISGVYDGSQGIDVLEFSVTQEGVHGTDDLAFEIRTSDGTLIDTLNIAATDPLNQVYTLSNGLNFSLDEGFLALNETFTVDVNHLVPTSVDPDLSFDGTGTNDAKLEDAFTVADGSFEINGNSIEVFANDSINSVLSRINSAGIDITATFDAATERIVMTHDQIGMEFDIVLSNDTSGFLAATKLDTAIAVSGNGDETSVLSDLNFMSGVTSGNLVVNGNSIAIDVDSDSLEDVLARIDVMLPNVDVDFDSESGLVSLVSSNMEDIVISSGSTGFFSAIGIQDGVYEAVEGRNITSKSRGLSFDARRETTRAIKEFSRRFNALFDNPYNESADSFISSIRKELKSAVTAAFSADTNSDFKSSGFSFEFDSVSDNAPFQFSESSHRTFSNSLKSASGAKDFNEFFFENENGDGLVNRMSDIVRQMERDLSIELAHSGSLVNVWA